MMQLTEMQAQMGVLGLRRVKRMATIEENPLKLQIRPLPDEPFNPEADDMRAMHEELIATLRKVFEAQPIYMEQLRHLKHADLQVLQQILFF
jgi:hypothetical protein